MAHRFNGGWLKWSRPESRQGRENVWVERIPAARFLPSLTGLGLTGDLPQR